MNRPQIKHFLASVLASELPVLQSRAFGPRTNKGLDLPRAAEDIAEELIREAIATGLPIKGGAVEKTVLGGGNTAEVVAKVTLHAPFAFKLDRAVKKLAEEGLAMRKIKQDQALPLAFRDAWPVIYAIRHHEPPYAYLMEFFPREDGWSSLEDRLYPGGQGLRPSTADCMRWIHKVLDVLFQGYEASVDLRRRPSLREDYVGRIRDRLVKTVERDARFGPQPLRIHGQPLRSWRDCLDRIDQHPDLIDRITPPFTTVTHGDPNPGNLMLRTTTAEIELKLIDPKEWMTGDYLFDMAKITHFLEGTGPAEKTGVVHEPPAADAAAEARLARPRFVAESGGAALDYRLTAPHWTDEIVNACLERTARFAAEHHDVHWLARYELGMAANFLGLPLSRLVKGREDAALILYGEGLKWLNRFCQRLEMVAPVTVAVAGKTEVEPAPLRLVRELVRAQVPGIREAQDRRGFQLLHWDSVRPNSAHKPNELSLEHEVRLMPVDAEAATRLLEVLVASENKSGAELLGAESRFAGLVVRRHPRESGPQSVDRYYDVPTGKKALIPRMITLRERLQGRSFMTWSTPGERMRPLNLELPFVALGESGLTVRLEFNWIDDPSISLSEALSDEAPENERKLNPLHLALQSQALAPMALGPVLEHTTYRQKFGLWPAVSKPDDAEVFTLNVDLVVAQDLKSHRVASYWDVDISAPTRVDEGWLQQLAELAGTLALRHRLKPNSGTKAWRDAAATGLLSRLGGD